MDFTGKTALITGASKGIGAATAAHFASLGAKVGLLARSAEPLNELVDMISVDGGQAWAYAGDVADYAIVENAVGDLVAKTGRIDLARETFEKALLHLKQTRLREGEQLKVDILKRISSLKESYRQMALV